MECLSLDSCWFMNANKPELHQHPFCHCETMPIPYKQVLDKATAKSITGKFDPFLFNTDGTRTHGKERLFIDKWGYSTADIPYMENEFEKQALEKYIAGEYTLGKCDKFGQRISVRISLPRKIGTGEVSFVSGWLVLPNGKIRLATPYGGK